MHLLYFLVLLTSQVTGDRTDARLGDRAATLCEHKAGNLTPVDKSKHTITSTEQRIDCFVFSKEILWVLKVSL